MIFPADLWLQAFVLTVAVEAPVAGWLLRPHAASDARLLLVIVLANLATQPAVWFILTQPLLYGTPQYTVAAESWAVLVEAVCYRVALPGIPVRRAALASLAANLASLAVGALLGAIAPGFVA